MTAAESAMDPGQARASDEEDLRREGERIAQLIEDLGAMAGAPVGQRVDELVRRLMHLYGTGLARLLAILGDTQPQGFDDATRARLRADALLSSLLVLHGIHPDGDAAREYDPGPDPAARAAARPSGLVQIDLGRSRAKLRAAKTEETR
jgi:hypothetical protein